VAIHNWWSDDPAEIYWMEITDRDDLGADLRAPKADITGNESWSYVLTSHVQPGDRVFHWHKSQENEPALVAWSEAVGPLETIEMSWQARGTRGRARGVPTIGEAWRMPLANKTDLATPITRSLINARYAEILAAMEEVAATVGKPIYTPFQNYGGRELRAQQGYLTKFPAALVNLLFELPPEGVVVTPRVASPRATTGQGYMSDALKRTALERHAVDLAIAFYWDAGATEIEELGKPFDLRVTLDGNERHVEVKGSTGVGIESVQLTQGEVDHAANWRPTDLFVVESIICLRGAGGAIRTSGGVVRHWTDWQPKAGSLRPTHLRYTLPG
jgi:hypothetical protein